MPITGTLPAVACNFIRSAYTPGSEDDGFGMKYFKLAPLSIVCKCSGDAITIL
jgi:hypothetical protein